MVRGETIVAYCEVARICQRTVRPFERVSSLECTQLVLYCEWQLKTRSAALYPLACLSRAWSVVLAVAANAIFLSKINFALLSVFPPWSVSNVL